MESLSFFPAHMRSTFTRRDDGKRSLLRKFHRNGNPCDELRDRDREREKEEEGRSLMYPIFFLLFLCLIVSVDLSTRFIDREDREKKKFMHIHNKKGKEQE